MLTRKNVIPLSLAIGCCFVSGCVSTSARFVRTDQYFEPRPLHSPPQLIIGQAAEVGELPNFRPVGIVEVSGPLSVKADRFIADAVTKGTEIGCDVLAHHSFYEVPQPSFRSRTVRLVSWQFSCGRFDSADHDLGAMKSAAFERTAKEIAIAKGAEACSPRRITGTHILKDACIPLKSTQVATDTPSVGIPSSPDNRPGTIPF